MMPRPISSKVCALIAFAGTVALALVAAIITLGPDSTVQSADSMAGVPGGVDLILQSSLPD